MAVRAGKIVHAASDSQHMPPDGHCNHLSLHRPHRSDPYLPYQVKRPADSYRSSVGALLTLVALWSHSLKKKSVWGEGGFRQGAQRIGPKLKTTWSPKTK